MQAALGAPPQHVLGITRPFVPYQVFQLALVEAAAEVPAERMLFARVPDDFPGERPVPAQHAREPDFRQARMRSEERRVGKEGRSGRGAKHCKKTRSSARQMR